MLNYGCLKAQTVPLAGSADVRKFICGENLRAGGGCHGLPGDGVAGAEGQGAKGGGVHGFHLLEGGAGAFPVVQKAGKVAC